MKNKHWFLVSALLMACALLPGRDADASSSVTTRSSLGGGESVTIMSNSGSGYNKSTINGKTFELKVNVLTYMDHTFTVPLNAVVKITRSGNTLRIYIVDELVHEETSK